MHLSREGNSRWRCCRICFQSAFLPLPILPLIVSPTFIFTGLEQPNLAHFRSSSFSKWSTYRKHVEPSAKENVKNTLNIKLPSTRKVKTPSSPRVKEGTIVNNVDMVVKPNLSSERRLRQPRKLS